MKSLVTMMLMAVMGLAAPAVQAGDSPAERAAALQRYLRAVPSTKLYDDMLADLKRTLLEGRREAVMAQFKSGFSPEVIDRITGEALVKIYTADEINALADFYESKHGASVMKKMPQLMSEMMPAIQREMFKAMQKIQQGQSGPSSK